MTHYVSPHILTMDGQTFTLTVSRLTASSSVSRRIPVPTAAAPCSRPGANRQVQRAEDITSVAVLPKICRQPLERGRVALAHLGQTKGKPVTNLPFLDATASAERFAGLRPCAEICTLEWRDR